MKALMNEHKKRLVEANEWGNYVAHRERLIRGGAGPAEATFESVVKFLGADVAVCYAPSLKRGGKKSGKETGLPTGEVYGGTTLLVARMADFAGKEATEVEVIRWVAEHVEIEDVQPSDCPSKAAWNLLVACKQNPMFKAEFWRSIYTKIVPNKAQLEPKAEEGATDGRSTLEMIERILDAASRAQGSGEGPRLTHTQEAVGSSPTPATKAS